MEKYIWLFPVLFVFHDFEEIIGFGLWHKLRKDKFQREFPKVNNIFNKMYNNFSTEGMACAVFEELCICIIICVYSLNTNSYLLWLGGFIGFILHLVMHIIQYIAFRGYIPAVLTSIIVLPISIAILLKCISITSYSLRSVIVFTVIGLFMIIINLKFAHGIMHKFTIWMDKLEN